VTHATAQHMMIRGLIERDHAAARVVLAALLGEPLPALDGESSMPREIARPLALALAAAALGAVAIGALAIGRLAVGRLTIKKAHLKALEVDELTVHRLRVLKDEDREAP
jgi:hypothetical protein